MTENKPTIFISHATWRVNNNERTIKILDELINLLKERWDVFVDREILKPADQWRSIILHKLSIARAGIILFDKTAVEKSDWVKAEALIMCFRKALDPDFQLIPVLLDDLKLDNECFEIYHPFQLKEIVVMDDNCSIDTCEISKKIVNDYLKIEKARTNSSFKGWMYEFEGLLFGMHPETLYEAWCTIDKSDKTLAIQDKDELRRAVVQLIHHLEPLQTIQAINRLRREFTFEKIERANRLIKTKWIANEWVGCFFTVIRECTNKLQLIFYTPEKTTKSLQHFECFVSRLRYDHPNNYTSIDKITVAETAGESNEAILFYVKREIAIHLAGPNHNPESEESKRLIRKRLSDSKTPIICYMPQSYAKRGVLSELHSQYPEIIFLIEVNFEENNNQSKFSDGIVLKPLLDEEKINEFDELRRQLELISTI